MEDVSYDVCLCVFVCVYVLCTTDDADDEDVLVPFVTRSSGINLFEAFTVVTPGGGCNTSSK